MKGLLKPRQKTNNTFDGRPKKDLTKPASQAHDSVKLKPGIVQKIQPPKIVRRRPINACVSREIIADDKENNPQGSNCLRKEVFDEKQMKDYLSNIVKRVDQCEKQIGLASKYPTVSFGCTQPRLDNILQQLNDEPAQSLSSMRSGSGLLKIKRKKSTLRILNPYA